MSYRKINDNSIWYSFVLFEFIGESVSHWLVAAGRTVCMNTYVTIPAFLYVIPRPISIWLALVNLSHLKGSRFSHDNSPGSRTLKR